MQTQHAQMILLAEYANLYFLRVLRAYVAKILCREFTTETRRTQRNQLRALEEFIPTQAGLPANRTQGCVRSFKLRKTVMRIDVMTVEALQTFQSLFGFGKLI